MALTEGIEKFDHCPCNEHLSVPTHRFVYLRVCKCKTLALNIISLAVKMYFPTLNLNVLVPSLPGHSVTQRFNIHLFLVLKKSICRAVGRIPQMLIKQRCLLAHYSLQSCTLSGVEVTCISFTLIVYSVIRTWHTHYRQMYGCHLLIYFKQ